MGSTQTQVVKRYTDPSPGKLDVEATETNIFEELASNLEGPLSTLLSCSDEAQAKYLGHEAVSENLADQTTNMRHYYDHRDVYDPITKGQYGLYENPEILAAYLHDINLDYTNNEEQIREQLSLIHTDPAWSKEQCDAHIMMSELRIVNQYNEYFNGYNDIVSTCINYHTSIDTDDDDIEHDNDIEASSPMSRDTILESRLNKKDTYQNGNQKTVCKNPLEIPEQHKGDTATEILYSQSASADETNKRYVSAIEIPMGNCKSIDDKSPIGTYIDTKNVDNTSMQFTSSKEQDTLHVYTHNDVLNNTDRYFENDTTKHPVYERIHYNMHNHDNLEIESAQLQKSDGKYYAHDTTPTSPSRIHFEADTFEYSDYDAEQQPQRIERTNKIEATCLGYTQANKLDNDKIRQRGYHVLPAKHGKLTGMFEHIPIPIMIDDGATIGIMPTSFYYLHNEIQRLPTIKPHHTRIHTGNGAIEAHFLIDLPLNIQGVLIQLRLLVCDSQVPAAVLLSRSAMVQLQITHNYNTSEIYIPYQSINVRLTNKVLIPPNTKVRCHGRLDRFEKDGQPCHISGRAIFWAYISSRYKPYIPLLVDIHQHTIVFTVYNRGRNTKTLHVGDRVGCIDVRSKDGSITRNLGYYTLQNLTEYAIFTHDVRFSELPGSYDHAAMASALEKIDFANESPADQKQNRLIISDKPTKQSLNEIRRLDSLKTDKYPWLDPNDPRRNMTDLEILKLKVNLSESELDASKKELLYQELLKYREAFSLRDEIGSCPFFEVSLKLKDDTPFFVRPYPIREDMKPVVQKEMDRLERLGIIKKGLTGYSSPVLLVKRKNQPLPRVVTDFRILNEKLVKVNHAFPLVRDCVDAIGAANADVYSVYDLRDAFHTLFLEKDSQKYCGVTPYYGADTYYYQRMGMGMSCSPGIWQQFINKIQQELPHKERYKIIMDDILIFSKWETHWQDIMDLLKVLIKYGLKISPHKCQLFRTKLVYMGLYFMIKNGRPAFTPMKGKCDAIVNMQSLKSVKECRQFCGMVNFLSTFLPKLRELLIPIYALTKKKAVFIWSSVCEQNFQKIKQLLIEPPVLMMPSAEGKFRLESDTSREACGGALYQMQDGEWRLLGYHSKRLPDAVRNYGVCELELTGLVCNIHGFEHLLKNNYFEVIIDHKAIEYLKKAKHEPTTRRIATLLLRLQDYTFDIKYLKGEKLKLSDALSRLYIEEKGQIDEVIPLSFLMHTTTPGTHAQLMFPAQFLYAHKAVTRKAVKTKRQAKAAPDSSGQLTPIPTESDKKIAQIPSNKGIKSIPQTKSKQVVTTNVKEIRRATHEQLNNEQKVATNDTGINTDLVQTIKVPSLEIIQAPKPLVNNDKPVTIYDKHIPKQEEIDKILQNLRTKVLRNININIDAQDLIREYDKSPRFKDVYSYILRTKLTANAIMHKKVVLDASNFVIANGFLLKLEKFKNLNKFDYRVLLCIPETFENAIFHMYHNSLTAFHQGHWKTFLTMKEIFYIPNMLNKLRNFINACTDCQKYKAKPSGQNPVQYGYMPKDYIPMESLACDIKYMPTVFGGYKFILMVTCEQTNFVIAVPMTDRTATHIAEAIITRVLSISGPPSYLSVDADQALTGSVIKILLESIECEMQIISPYNHGSSKAERQIRTISEMIVKKLTEKGDRWPLYAAIAAYAMNTYASDALQGLTPFELVFIRKPRILLGYKFKPLDEYPVTIRHYIQLLQDRANFLRSVQMDWKIKQANSRHLLNEMYKEVKRYQIGDIVYALAPCQTALHTKTRKFRQDYVGPFIISDVYDDTHYQLKVTDGKIDRVVPGIWHANRLKLASQMTPDGVIQSEEGLKQYLARIENDQPMGHLESIPQVRDTLDKIVQKV